MLFHCIVAPNLVCALDHGLMGMAAEFKYNGKVVRNRHALGRLDCRLPVAAGLPMIETQIIGGAD